MSGVQIKRIHLTFNTVHLTIISMMFGKYHVHFNHVFIIVNTKCKLHAHDSMKLLFF